MRGFHRAQWLVGLAGNASLREPLYERLCDDLVALPGFLL